MAPAAEHDVMTQLEVLRAQVAVARQANDIAAVKDDHQRVRIQCPGRVVGCQGYSQDFDVGKVGRRAR